MCCLATIHTADRWAFQAVTHPPDALPWHTDNHQVLDFAAVLTAAGTLTTARDALDYLDSPHRFHPEHALWTRCGRPRPPSPDDLANARQLGRTSPQATELRRRHHTAAATWDAFCALLDEFDHTGRPLRAVDRH